MLENVASTSIHTCSRFCLVFSYVRGKDGSVRLHEGSVRLVIGRDYREQRDEFFVVANFLWWLVQIIKDIIINIIIINI